MRPSNKANQELLKELDKAYNAVDAAIEAIDKVVEGYYDRGEELPKDIALEEASLYGLWSALATAIGNYRNAK